MANENGITIPINCDDSELEAALEKAGKSMKKFGDTAEKVSDGLKGWGGMAERLSIISVGIQNVSSAALGFVKGLTDSFVTYGDQLDKTSLRLNMSTEDLSRLKFAAEQCGAGFDESVDAIKTFQEQLGAARLGDAGAIGKLGAVGIDYAAFEGLDSKDQFLKLADHIASIGDTALQTRTAIELFGDAGFRLLPFFQQGKDGIEDLCAEADRLGFTFGGEDSANAAKLSDEINRMKKSCENLARQFLASIAGGLTPFLEWCRDALQGIGAFMKENPRLVKAIAAVTAALAAAGVALTVFTTVWTAFMLTNPAGWILGITAGVVALGAAWLAVGEAEESVLKQGDEKRDADYESMKRLDELAEKERLTNRERKEAAKLIEEVSSRYGDLGITIDETTGKIHGMTDAQKRFTEVARKQRQEELQAEIAARQRQMREDRKALKEESESLTGQYSRSFVKTVTFGAVDSRADRKERIAAAGKELELMKAELEALQDGETPFAAEKKEIAESDSRYDAAVAAFSSQSEGLTSEAAAAESESARAAAEKLAALQAQYETQKKVLDTLGDELALRKKRGWASEEDEALEKELTTRREALELMLTEAEAQILAQRTEAERLAIAKEQEEIKRKQNEIQQKILELAGEEEVKAASRQKLEALREQNRLYLEQLSLRTDITEQEKEAERAKVSEREKRLSDRLLQEGDLELESSPQAEGVREAESEYYDLLTTKGAKKGDIAAAKKRLEASKAEYQSYTVEQTKAKMQAAEAVAGEKMQAYQDLKSSGTATPDELLQAQQDARDAKDRAAQLRSDFQSAADAGFQSEKPTDLTHTSQGTFSAFGLDALTQSDIPKETLDWVKKAVEKLTSIDENSTPIFAV